VLISYLQKVLVVAEHQNFTNSSICQVYAWPLRKNKAGNLDGRFHRNTKVLDSGRKDIFTVQH
jgi:hypothetical protein